MGEREREREGQEEEEVSSHTQCLHVDRRQALCKYEQR